MLGSGTTKKILAHLRSKLRNSVPFNRMKLMVVGLQVSIISDIYLLEYSGK